MGGGQTAFQDSKLAPSLTGLAHTDSPATGKGLATQPLSANTSLSYLGAAGAVGMASHLTRSSISEPIPSCGSQSLGQKESRKSPDVAQHLTGKRMEDQVC